MHKTQRLTLLGMLAAVATLLGLIERQFVLVPAVPAIRLGLGNAALLVALYALSTGDAWLLALLKAVMGCLLFSGFQALPYALCGGAAAMAAMTLLRRARFGVIGVSVGGACAHALGQTLISRPMLGSWAAAAQLPWLLIASIRAGALTGAAAALTISRLPPTRGEAAFSLPTHQTRRNPS